MNQPLNLPHIELKTCVENGIVKVYDPLRDKYVALTPEEFVRQHFTSYLINNLGYPPTLMANEVKVVLNGMPKRCDTLIYSPWHGDNPLMIVEYKAPDVPITQETFDQIVRYNMILKVHFLIVSNGLNTFCCVMDYINSTYNFIPEIPPYSSFMGSEQ